MNTKLKKYMVQSGHQTKHQHQQEKKRKTCEEGDKLNNYWQYKI